MRRVEVFEHLVHSGRRHGPVGVLLSGAQPGRQRGLGLRGGDGRPQSALDGRRLSVVWEEAALRVAVGAASRGPGRARRTRRWSDAITWGCAMPRPQTLSRRDHSKRGSLTRKVSTRCREGWSMGFISSTPRAVALRKPQAPQPVRKCCVARLVRASM